MIQPHVRFTRPRVGLALSGGAARGIAHAGVLRALEENAIPIDAIAGAPMNFCKLVMTRPSSRSMTSRDLLLAIRWPEPPDPQSSPKKSAPIRPFFRVTD
jgi:NTE family protein